MPHRWMIVGSGRCGLQLARGMAAAGVPLAGVVVRSRRGAARVRRWLPGVAAIDAGAPLPPAEAVLISVPDDALAATAAALALRLPPRCAVALHTSGVYGGDVLVRLRERGVAVGSFHPLLAFARAGGPPAPLHGALAAVEGERAAVRVALALARTLGMVGRRLAAADKPRYHAAAVIAANLTHVLIAEGLALLGAAGFRRREAARALRPLIDAAVTAALDAHGLERLTGPVARGDAATVAAHLAVLDPPLACAYRAVAALAIARLRPSGNEAETAKPALDSVLRALTAIPRCASVPLDESD